jgi:hypothetical protein
MKRPKQTKLADQTPCLLIEVQGDNVKSKILKERFDIGQFKRYKDIAKAIVVINPRIFRVINCISNEVLIKQQIK